MLLKALLALNYSRDREAKVDTFLVAYLTSTDYACDRAARFFEMVLRGVDEAYTPVFLSGHPASSDRA